MNQRGDTARSLTGKLSRLWSKTRQRKRRGPRTLTFERQEERLMFFIMAMTDMYSNIAHSTSSSPQTKVVAPPGVLANDSNMSGGTMTAELGTGPAHAQSFTLNADGSFSYTPDAYFVGQDSFTYYAKTSTATSSLTTVYLGVTNTVPNAFDDMFLTKVNETLLVLASPTTTHLLSNDHDPDSQDEIWITGVTSETHGEVLAWTPEGSFIFEPDEGFTGSASFVYTLTDGIATDQATVVVTVENEAWAQLEAERPRTCCVVCGCNVQAQMQNQSGQVSVDVSQIAGAAMRIVSGGLMLTGRLSLSANAGSATSIAVEPSWGGEKRPAYFDPATMGSTGAYEFTFPANTANLRTGRYPYSFRVKEWFANAPMTVTRYTAWVLYADPNDSPMGNGWWLTDLERLYPESNGMALRRGDGNLYWLPKNTDGTYGKDPGDLLFATLTAVTGGFELTDKYGTVSRFTTQGILTAREDRNGNVTTFTYADKDGDGEADDPTLITQANGQTTTFEYSGGKISKIIDFDGRETLLGAGMSSITLPDPDGTGPLTSPVTSFTYGANGYLASYTTPDNETTSFDYNSAGSAVKRTNPDNSTVELTATFLASLVDPNTGIGTSSNPAPLIASADVKGSLKDERGNITEFKLDRYGGPLWVEDALGNVTTYTRNSHGLVVSMTEPDPDGTTGPLPAHTTNFTYDTRGNVTQVTLPSSATRTWTYDPNLSQVTSHTDAAGKETRFQLDASGNVTAIQEVVGTADSLGMITDDVVTTLTYTTSGYAGLVDTITDPLGRVTNVDYSARGLPTKITYPDTKFVQMEYSTANNLTALVDELARRTEYTYDYLDRRTKEKLPDPDGPTSPLLSPETQYAYDAMSRLTKVTDALGRVTDYVYDNRSRLKEIREPDHDGVNGLTVTTFDYDLTGNRTKITDPLGRQTSFAYDAIHRLTSLTEADPDGVGALTAPVTQWTYDAMSRVTQVLDALSHATDISYENYGLTVVSLGPDPDGAGSAPRPETRTVSNAEGDLLEVRDPLANSTSWIYDDLRRLTRIDRPDPDGGTNPTSTLLAYDKVGNLRFVTDAMSNVTEYVYDSRNRNTQVLLSDPDGTGPLAAPVYAFGYDDAGQLVTSTDPLNHTTSYLYDFVGRLTQVTQADPDGAGSLTAPVTKYEYDAYGNLTKVIDPLLQATTYEYDTLNNQKKITLPDPDGAGSLVAPVTTLVHDAARQLISKTEPLSRTTSFSYDNLGRLKLVTPPNPGTGSPTTEFAYDAVGNVLSVKDALAHQTNYTYDALYRRITETDANGDTTTFGYDLVGNLTSLQDPELNTTTFVYDDLYRMISETNQLSDTRTYEYDLADNLIRKVDRNGRATDYTFDNLYRLIDEAWTAAGSSTPFRHLTFSYDVASRMTNASDPDSAYTFTYDNLDRVTSVVHGLTALPADVVMQQAFNARGNRTSLSTTIDTTADFKNTFTYDNIGRMTRIVQAGQTGGNAVATKRIDMGYDAGSRLTNIKRYATSGTTQLAAESVFTYDTVDRLKTLNHKKGTTNLATYTWTWDKANRITKLVSTDGTVDYTYDNADQLTGEDYTYQTDKTWMYDDNGNRTNAGYSTGTNNQLTSDGTYNYTYDDEGNRILRTKIATGETTEYVWDHHNRLTKITEKDSTGAVTEINEYSYDVFDRRISKTVRPPSGPVAPGDIEYYVYDGPHVALQFDGNGDLTHRYLHGPMIDQILADEAVTSLTSAGTVLWPLTDNLGTVRDLAQYAAATNTTTIANHIKYDAFGNITSESNAAVDHLFGYTGRERDEESGLSYYRARYYDPAVGRFVSEDPIGFQGGDSNLSRYVSNSSPNATDPSGLEYRGYWEGVLDVYKGYGDAAVGTLKGGWFMVRHPVQTVKGVSTAIRHPIRTAKVICEDASEKSGTLRGQGELVGDVLIGVASGGAVKAASKTATVARITNKLGNLPSTRKFANKIPENIRPAPSKGPSLQSSNRLYSIERATPELLDAVSSKGRTIKIVEQGTEEARYLDFIGAEANVGGECMNHILLRPNPGKAAVLEEFLHGTQHRLGIIQRLGMSGAERHVKDFMIRHRQLLGLGDEDVEILRQLMDAGL